MRKTFVAHARGHGDRLAAVCGGLGSRRLDGLLSVSQILRNGRQATLGRKDQLILSAAKATLLLAALIVFSAIAIAAGFRSAIRHFTSRNVREVNKT
jgi:hypothetical protein